VEKLWSNARYFKKRMKEAGFNLGVSETPITPIMLGEAKTAQEFSRRLFEQNVFAMAIGFPTVPLGKARIRVMISATHSEQDLDYGIDKFVSVANDYR
jgi:glycine C-acetyltransferase